MYALEKIDVRTLEAGDWFWVNKDIVLRDFQQIKPAGLAVYCMLAASTDRHQSCYPSNGFLARKLGYSRSTIKRALHNLERTGLIVRGKSSRRRRSYYLLKTRRTAHH